MSNTTSALTIQSLLPDVYRGETADALYTSVFNPLLSPRDLRRVYGGIGNQPPVSSIRETTPRDQAFQVRPVARATQGTIDYTLTYDAFLSQLTSLGVDTDRIAQWGSADEYVWLPPTNIDKLLNFSDYFWTDPNTEPEYVTIEGGCTQLLRAATAYSTVLDATGDIFADITLIDNDTFGVPGDTRSIFTPGFVFYTIDGNTTTLQLRRWTTSTAEYVLTQDVTKLNVVNEINQPVIAPEYDSDTTAGLGVVVGELYFNTTTTTFRVWTGVLWEDYTGTTTVSLRETLNRLRSDVNCACFGSRGWDVTFWDFVGSQGAITISDAPPSVPQIGDLWYSPPTDELSEWVGMWDTLVPNASTNPDLYAAIATGATTNASLWDLSSECSTASPTTWAGTNAWVHRGTISNASGITRASRPIVELDERVELNQWYSIQRGWAYRDLESVDFASITTEPTALEVSPIRAYVATYEDSGWTIRCRAAGQTVPHAVDYTDYFQPGKTFAITNSAYQTSIYTTSSVAVETITDPAHPAASLVGTGVPHTTIRIVEAAFTSVPVAGTASDTAFTHIIPTTTSVGSPWAGYGIHWVYTGIRSTLPRANLPELTNTYDTSPVEVLLLPPGATSGRHTSAWVEYTVGASAVSFPIPTALYDPTVAQIWSPALPADASLLRVYVNGQRTYGGFSLTTTSVPIGYVVDGPNIQLTRTVTVVTGVTFESPPVSSSSIGLVRIETGAATPSETARAVVPIRTSLNDSSHNSSALSGLAPAITTVVRADRAEQVRSQVGQVPNLNIYDIGTSAVVLVGLPISATPNPTTVGGYTYTTQLVGSAGQHRAYRLAGVLPDQTLWYNPASRELLQWVSGAWQSTFTVAGPTTTVTHHAHVGDEPNTPFDGQTWYSPSTNSAMLRGSGGWMAYNTPIIVSTTDPGLTALWRRDQGHTYVPKYVDRSGSEVPVGTPDGDWEVLRQWRFNMSSRNKSTLTSAELTPHFLSISVDMPNPVPIGNIPAPALLTQSSQLSEGRGTIHAYSDQFDLLVSAVFDQVNSPITVIESAQRQYESLLLSVYNTAMTAAADLPMGELHTDAERLARTKTITQALHANNDALVATYGDSPVEHHGGPTNWVSTAPYIGLARARLPHYSRVGPAIVMFHHDGHESTIRVSAGDAERIARKWVSSSDPRTGTTLGRTKANIPPSDVATLVLEFGYTTPTPVSGILWLNTRTKTLYVLDLVAVSAVDPDPIDTPEGSYYFNTTSAQLHRLVQFAWQPIAAPNTIAPAWKVTSVDDHIAASILAFEQLLYDGTPDQPTIESLLPPNTTSGPVWDEYLDRRILQYALDNDIDRTTNESYRGADPFTWNYAATPLTPGNIPRIVGGIPTLAIPLSSPSQLNAAWQFLYFHVYGTARPDLEPWVLQGYPSRPSWWEAEYISTTLGRRWSDTMWLNVRQGIIPSNRQYPDGTISTGDPFIDNQVLPTYLYTSVHSDSTVGIPGYQLDQLLPPYVTPVAPHARSLYADASLVLLPAAPYVVNTNTPTEWNWRVSVRAPYDRAIAMFQLEPVRFIGNTYDRSGYTTVDTLRYATNTQTLLSHTSVLHHGEYTDGIHKRILGLGHWYATALRVRNTDINDIFNTLWRTWEPLSAYQLEGVTDAGAIRIETNTSDLTSRDYSIVTTTGTTVTIPVDSLLVTIGSIPPLSVQYNNQLEWCVSVAAAAPQTRTLTVPRVKAYSCVIDPGSNVVYPGASRVVGIDRNTNAFTVHGDQTPLVAGSTITIINSRNNSGEYTVVAASYVCSTNRTTIAVTQSISNPGCTPDTPDGIVLYSRFPAWDLGTGVVLTSGQTRPTPLAYDTPYYVVPHGLRGYKLAETASDARTGFVVELSGIGAGEITIGEFTGSFEVFGGNSASPERWYHYALDLSDELTVRTPTKITGLQRLIDFVDGLEHIQRVNGIVFASSSPTDFDSETGRVVGWQLELERFIDWAYRIRQSSLRIVDSFVGVVNASSNTIKFTGAVPGWPAGTPVVIRSTHGGTTQWSSTDVLYVAPSGLDATIHLASVPNPSTEQLIIFASSDDGARVTIGGLTARRSLPTLGINPFAAGFHIATPIGSLASVTEGPYPDASTTRTLYDQYGEPLTGDQISVYRRGHIADVVTVPALLNPLIPDASTPREYRHIGGANVDVITTRHVIVFNEYATDGALLYDPFLGIATAGYELDYVVSGSATLNNIVPGFIQLDGNGVLEPNIDTAIANITNAYDTSDLVSPSVRVATTQTLGYQSPNAGITALIPNELSEQAFVRGMMHATGTRRAIDAMVRTSGFVGATVEEYHAYPVAEFGDAGIVAHPLIALKSSDSNKPSLRFEFLHSQESGIGDASFETITVNNTDRVINQPLTRRSLGEFGFIRAATTSLTTFVVGVVAPDNASAHNADYVVVDTTITQSNPSPFSLQWQITEATITHDGVSTLDVVYLTSPTRFDEARVTSSRYDPSTGNYITRDLPLISNGGGAYVVNNTTIRVSRTEWTGILTVFAFSAKPTELNAVGVVNLSIGGVVEQRIPIWDPIKGIHTADTVGLIDILTHSDQAQYTNRLASAASDTPWLNEKTDTTWISPSAFVRQPYDDIRITPVPSDLIRNWGALAEWATPRAWRWVESTRPPIEWGGTGTVYVETYVRTRPRFTVTSDPLDPTVFVAPPPYLIEGDAVTIITTDIDATLLPTAVSITPRYFVRSLVPGVSFQLASEVDSSILVDDRADPLPQLEMVRRFNDVDWQEQPTLSHTASRVELVGTGTVDQLAVTVITWEEPTGPTNPWVYHNNTTGEDALLLSETTVQIYVNGIRSASGIAGVIGGTVSVTVSPDTPLIVTEPDEVVVVRRTHELSDVEIAFEPEVDDPSSIDIQWRTDTPYSTRARLVATTAGLPDEIQQMYYFWVGDQTDGNEPTVVLSREFTRPSRAFHIVTGLREDAELTLRFGYGTSPFSTSFDAVLPPSVGYTVPMTYRLSALVGLTRTFDPKVHALRYTLDHTLRTSNRQPGFAQRPLNLRHVEWALIRPGQPSKIPRELWDVVTESLAGHELADPLSPIPALDYVFYDQLVPGASSRYGYGLKRAFVDAEHAHATILHYLSTTETLQGTFDVVAFLRNYPLTKSTDVVGGMSELYATLSTHHLNTLWFELLQDALSVQRQSDLLKTSWIAINVRHSLVPLRV